MREWDADGSGMVGVGELSAAAQAYKKASCALSIANRSSPHLARHSRRFSKRVA